MAEISLKQYLANLDTLLQDNAIDEAIYNARHILEHQPKNLQAQRRLAQALLQKGAWGDAESVLRRILSVMPDDYEAHQGLGEALQHLRKLDEAIWHLERAFEQDPNNRTLIEALRELYRKHRNIDQAKIPLTTGAVARQYARNTLFDQAINTLQRTLTQSPERMDLRLLLARILYESGRRVESAEVALDVLARLPDCLEANLILSELWLNEQRPSDAQRYLSRIEAVDPYMALELAQGTAPDEDAVLIPELDYQAVARRDLTTENPDWLLDMNVAVPVGAAGDDVPDDFDALFDMDDLPDAIDVREFAVVGLDDLDDANNDDLFPISDDWLTDDAAHGVPDQDSPAPAAAVRPEISDWLSQFADLSGDAAAEGTPPVVRKRTGMTGMLARLEGEAASTPEQPADVPNPAAMDFSAPVAAQPALNFDNLFDDDQPDATDSDDVLAWLSPADDQASADKTPARVTGELDDPLAWMRGSDVELVEKPVSTRPRDLFVEEEIDVTLQAADEVDSLAWMRTSGLEIVEDERTATIFAAAALDDSDDAEDEQEDTLSWLRGSGIDLEDTGVLRSQERPAARPVPEPQPTEPQRTTSEWLDQQDDSLFDEMMALEALSTDEVPSIAQNLDVPGAGLSAAAQERQGTMDNEDFARWFDADDDETEAEQEDSLAWLNTDFGDDSDAADADKPAMTNVPDLFGDDEDNALDWMREPDLEASPAAAPAIGSLFDDPVFEWDEALTPNDQPAAGVPDWLSSVEEIDDALMLDDEAADDAPVAAEPAAAWLSSDGLFDTFEMDEADDTQFAWANALDTEIDADIETETPPAAGSVPDWLSGVDMFPTAAASSDESDADEFVLPAAFGQTEISAADEVTGDELDWSLFGEEEEEAEGAVAAVGTETPSWLNEMSFGDEDADEEEEAFADEVAESMFEPAAFEQSVLDDSEDDEVTGDELDWSLFDDDEEEAEDAVAAVGTATPSWLSEMSFGDEDADDDEKALFADEVSESMFEPAAFGQSLLDDAEDDEATGDELDWSLFGEDEEEAEGAVAAVGTATPSWLNEMSFGDEDADEEDEVAESMFEPAAFGQSLLDDADAEDELDWSLFGEDEEEAEGAVAAVGTATPSWLSEMSFGDEDADDDEEAFADEVAESIFEPAAFGQSLLDDAEDDEAIGDELDWSLFGDDEEEEAEDAVAAVGTETPSWLNEMSFGDEDADDEFVGEVAESMFEPAAFGQSMLDDAEDDEAIGDELDWSLFSDEEEEADEEDALEPAAAAPDWMTALAIEENLDAAPELYGDDEDSLLAVTGDVPEWLAPSAALAAVPTGFDLAEEDSEGQDAEEPAAVTGAAPDWLNAMVPGLDVDYEAEAESPVEQEFRQDAVPAVGGRDFGWLDSIVREEMSQPPTLPETPGVSVKRRFNFSRRPAWLRRLTGQAAQPEAAAVTAEPFDVDQLGDELPPWLSYDDADDDNLK